VTPSSRETLVVVEHAGGEPADVSLQALSFARSHVPNAGVHALLIGPGGREAAAGLGSHGVATAHVAEHDALSSFAPGAWARIVVETADRLGASTVAAAGSDVGNEVLARVAARLDLPFAANVVAAVPDQPLRVTRTRWGGSLLEEARLHAARELLTVTPHTVAAEAVGGPDVIVEPFTPTLDDSDLVVRVVEHVAAPAGGVSLVDAKVVVSGGRGAGSAEGFGVIEELAALLGGAVGCSRVVTSAGWRPHTDQVGQTGTKISPELYIPCGISGATQHIAGCRGAKRILAVNADPEAAIFASADYAVIGDLHEILPAISAEVRRVKGG
jgi:electron transfer flavoprotein alpha subunit